MKQTMIILGATFAVVTTLSAQQSMGEIRGDRLGETLTQYTDQHPADCARAFTDKEPYQACLAFFPTPEFLAGAHILSKQVAFCHGQLCSVMYFLEGLHLHGETVENALMLKYGKPSQSNPFSGARFWENRGCDCALTFLWPDTDGGAISMTQWRLVKQAQDEQKALDAIRAQKSL